MVHLVKLRSLQRRRRMRYKMITKENIKEGDSVQFCGFYILKAKELVDSGFEPDYFYDILPAKW